MANGDALALAVEIALFLIASIYLLAAPLRQRNERRLLPIGHEVVVMRQQIERLVKERRFCVSDVRALAQSGAHWTKIDR
jgi:hypothetical protein